MQTRSEIIQEISRTCTYERISKQGGYHRRRLRHTDQIWHMIADWPEPHEHDKKIVSSCLWSSCLVRDALGTNERG